MGGKIVHFFNSPSKIVLAFCVILHRRINKAAKLLLHINNLTNKV